MYKCRLLSSWFCLSLIKSDSIKWHCIHHFCLSSQTDGQRNSISALQPFSPSQYLFSPSQYLCVRGIVQSPSLVRQDKFSFFFQSCKMMTEIKKKEHSANNYFPSLDVGKQALNMLQDGDLLYSVQCANKGSGFSMWDGVSGFIRKSVRGLRNFSNESFDKNVIVSC